MLIQVILVLIFAAFIALSWKRSKEKVISLGEAALWTLLWVAGAVVTLIPKTTDYVASLVGVGRGADLVLYLAMACMFYLIFKLFINYEKLEKKLTEMVRKDTLSELDKKDGEKL